MTDGSSGDANRNWLLALAVAIIVAGPVLHYMFGAPRWLDFLLLAVGTVIAARELTLLRRRG